ncbi:MAG: hypothetical protein HYY96_17965 [Candidatus Tectomicrobia bacterium]|nr:hypothetical protein [Candidatus Tectomicrobia bacterium]
MADSMARDKLLQFLNERVFLPVMNAENPYDKKEENERFAMFNYAQIVMKRLAQEYRTQAQSAEQVYQHFLFDLSSQASKYLVPRFRWIGVTWLDDVKTDFQKLYESVSRN